MRKEALFLPAKSGKVAHQRGFDYKADEKAHSSKFGFRLVFEILAVEPFPW
jgi:hypothetical protein